MSFFAELKRCKVFKIDAAYSSVVWLVNTSRRYLCLLLLIYPVLTFAFVGPTPAAVFYPEEALEKCIEGWVHLSYDFSSDKMATNIRVLDSEPAGIFEEAAISALSIWTFSDEQVSNPENTEYVFRYNLEEGVEACLLEKNSNDQEE